MKALHYTDVAVAIRDFCRNKRAITETLYVEIWNIDDNCEINQVDIERDHENNIITAKYIGNEEMVIGEWSHKDEHDYYRVYETVYKYVANLHSGKNWFFARKESKGLHVERGDYNTGWYAIADVVINLTHEDWCIFDDRGYVGVNFANHAICYISKSVADDYKNAIENLGRRLIAKWAMPISDPTK